MFVCQIDEGGLDSVAAKAKGMPNSSNTTVAAAEFDWGDIAYPPEYPFAEADSDDNIVIDDENHKTVMYANVSKKSKTLRL